MTWVRVRLCKLQKRVLLRLADASDTVYLLLPHGPWFTRDTPVSSTTKTGRYDIAESGEKHQKSINHQSTHMIYMPFIIHFSDVTLLFRQWNIFKNL
jgi:hypothetical protein